VTGIVIKEDCGDWTRTNDIAVVRTLPFGATIRGFQPTVDVSAA
jgi:hypothetical protein